MRARAYTWDVPMSDGVDWSDVYCMAEHPTLPERCLLRADPDAPHGHSLTDALAQAVYGSDYDPWQHWSTTHSGSGDGFIEDLDVLWPVDLVGPRPVGTTGTMRAPSPPREIEA